jgi:ABC-type transporter lipoprotein component MlaA
MTDQAQVANSTVSGDTTAAPEQQPQLGINDLLNLRAIIDVAVKRGAFGAAEISAVGTTFDKLNVFLNAVAPQGSTDTAQTPSA